MKDPEELYLIETMKSLKGLKSTCEKAIIQINDNELHFQSDPDSNSVAIIMKHISGNMISRFTDFLTTDGEKEWRNRDDEFINENLSRKELLNFWEKAWNILFDTLSTLKSDDLSKIVYIRKEEHTVLRALQRQLVHYAYHTGQIVYICKQIKKQEFNSLSIPKKSERIH
jgi:hypothetical protein